MGRAKNLTKTAVHHCMTSPGPHHARQRMLNSPMQTMTSTASQRGLGSNGSHPSQSPSGQRSPTWDSAGICMRTLCTFPRRRKPNTWQLSQSERRGIPTTSSRCRSSTASFSMHPWSSLQDALFSPAWKPCLAPSITVLSSLTPHPATPQMTSAGGNASSAAPTCPDPYSNPNPSSIFGHTRTPVPGLALQSLLAPDGERGSWCLDGSLEGETSSGQRQSASNFLPSVYAHFRARETTSYSMGTTAELLRDGGSGAVPTSQQITSSGMSSSYQRIAVEHFTRGTLQVPKTQQTLPHEAAIPTPSSSSTPSLSHPVSGPSLLMSDPSKLARGVAIRHFTQAWEAEDGPPGVTPLAPKQWRAPEARPQNITIPPALAASARVPPPYPQNLTPIPSLLRPHCLAKNRLREWTPIPLASASPDLTALSVVERERVKDTMLHAWEEDTRVSYGAGLLIWHCFCDSRSVPEAARAPASQALLSAFVAYMAAAYSGKTIAGYLSGVRAWHLLHSLPWVLDKKEMDTMLQAADKLTPSTSKRKKHCPYTPNFISAVQQHLDLDKPLDAAVFACLTTCFYASA